MWERINNMNSIYLNFKKQNNSDILYMSVKMDSIYQQCQYYGQIATVLICYYKLSTYDQQIVHFYILTNKNNILI